MVAPLENFREAAPEGIGRDVSGQTNEGSLWGARFSAGPSSAMNALGSSLHFDWRLARYDLDASLAHAHGLAGAGLLSPDQEKALTSALEGMKKDLHEGKLVPEATDEDVHGALERILIERLGPEMGGLLRAGRSRNDQIATFVRMFMRDSAASLRALLLRLAEVLVTRADEVGEAAMPARTHFQHAQPVLVAHYLLAHAWPLVRSIQRFDDWSSRNQESPYGAGAVVGGGLGVDSHEIARRLGFDSVSPNSLDATSSRDGVTEFLFITAQIGVDLSRLAEELVVFSSSEFSYVSVDDAYATGSSMMPQKKNPDIAELTRGKAGRLIGNLTGLLATLKALPLAYNRDLQEDKEPLFDSVDTLHLVLPAFTGMIETLTFHLDTMAANATAGFALATDVADWLVRQGVPFRDAHEIVGQLVSHCEQVGCELQDVSDEGLASISAHLTPEVRSVMNVTASIAAKSGPSGTAASSVKAQREALKQTLALLQGR